MPLVPSRGCLGPKGMVLIVLQRLETYPVMLTMVTLFSLLKSFVPGTVHVSMLARVTSKMLLVLMAFTPTLLK